MANASAAAKKIPATTPAAETPPAKTLAWDWSPRRLYDITRVQIRIRDKICGGQPKNKELLLDWIKANTGHEDTITVAQTEEAKATILHEESEKSWNGFPEDEKGLFIWARQVKAMFRESATMLRVTTEKRGSKQIFQHGFEIKALPGSQTSKTPVKDMGEDARDSGEHVAVGEGHIPSDRLYLSRMKPDGMDEGPIHVQTAQGPRSAIKRVDYCQYVLIEFEIWVLATHPSETRHVGEMDIREMMLFAQENGLGADRSQGMGKFDVVGFDVVQKVERKGK